VIEREGETIKRRGMAATAKVRSAAMTRALRCGTLALGKGREQAWTTKGKEFMALRAT
jgi:hypothetical protein